MLIQYDFSVRIPGIEHVYSEIAVKIHGALMYRIPQEKAQQLHEKKYHPFSLYCVPGEEKNIVLTRISSLHESCDIVPETASGLDSLLIKGAGKAEIIQKGELFRTSLPELMPRTNGRTYRLLFLTPSVFKTAGKESGFPDVTMHFISVIRRMNEFEGEQLDFDSFRKAFYHCQFGEWQFQQYDYNISGIHLPGMTGHADILLPSDAEEQKMLKKIFLYASFSGTGGRTGMGMGGFFFQKL